MYVIKQKKAIIVNVRRCLGPIFGQNEKKGISPYKTESCTE